MAEQPSPIPKAVAEELLRFMEYHPAARLSHNLRKMLMEFLMSDGAVESIYLKDLLYDLDALFDFLEIIDRQRLHDLG